MLAELRRRNVHRAAVAYLALAWLLVQVAATLLPLFGAADATLRAVVLVFAVGFVPAMVASWSFELTPEGLKRERDVPDGSALEARTNRLLDRLIMVLLALGLTYFAVDKFVLDPARDEARISEAREAGRSEARIESYGDRSIVVLPFDNLSADPEQVYLAEGLAEELLNLLAKIPQLRVISRTSAFSYKGKDLKLAEIAKELRITHVLQGSVRKSGDRLRIAAQLIDARTDTQLWSQTFDRSLDDVFAIQDEIAAAVVGQLQPRLLGELPRARRADTQAYLAFVQARQFFVGSPRDLARVERLLRTALEFDPDYADAWVGLASLYWQHRLRATVAGEPFFVGMSADEADQRSREAIERALTLDPDNAAGLAWMAIRKGLADRDLAAAAKLHERSLKLDPSNADVLRLAGIFATLLRRDELMLALTERSVERDPLCNLCIRFHYDALLMLDRLDDAERLLRPAVAADPTAFWYSRAVIGLFRGDPAAAHELTALGRPPPQAAEFKARAMALWDLGRTAEATAQLEQLKRQTDLLNLPLQLAQVHAWFGERELAIDWAEKQLEQVASDGYIYYWVVADPILRRKLDGHPRWEALQRRFGVAPEQLALIKFDPELPAAAMADND